MSIATSIPQATPGVPTIAQRRWNANVQANLAALDQTQPAFAQRLRIGAPALTPVFGRDGSLTATLGGNADWLSGCSLPDRTARHTFRKLNVGGVVACFIEPQHGAQVRAVLDRLQSRQAVITVTPSIEICQQMIGCSDFAADIAANRLFLTGGTDWPSQLEALFLQFPGLPSPQQFVRLPSIDNARLEPLMLRAQDVFMRVNGARTASLSYYRDNWRAPARQLRRVCLLAGSQFSLWDDAGETLAQSLQRDADTPISFHRLDADDPASSSTVALASSATACDVLLSANLSRADIPGVLPLDLPWLTWVTRSVIPPFSTAGPRDRLLLADAEWARAAIDAGWPEERLCLAQWPAAPAELPPDVPSSPHLAIIADTTSLVPDADIEAFSSHLLLWNTIWQDLVRDPFSLDVTPRAYLSRRMTELGVAEQGLDRGKFINKLIVPAYQQGIAAAMARSNVPLRIAGRGWEQVEACRARHSGPILTRGDLVRAISGPSAIVHAWPSADAHPLDAWPVATVRSWPGSAASFSRRVSAALSRRTEPARPIAQALSVELLERVLAIV